MAIRPTSILLDRSLYRTEWREKKETERRDTLLRRLISFYPQFECHVNYIFEDYMLDDKPKEAMSFSFQMDNGEFYIVHYSIRYNSATLYHVYLKSQHKILQLSTERVQ